MYNVHAVLQSSSFPVLQFSSPPVYQFSRSSSSWSRSLETHSGESTLRGVQAGRLRGVAWIPTPRRSPRRLSSPILPRLGAPVRHLGTKMPQHLPRYPKNTILEPTSSSRAPKTLPRQPAGPSRGGPKPQKNTKRAVVLFVFTLQPFFQ